MALTAVRLGAVLDAAVDTTTYTVYTVPAGRRAILRDVRIYKLSGAANTVQVTLKPAGGAGPNIDILRVEGMTAGQTRDITDGFIVLDAGDFITIRSYTGSSRIALSGHEFVV